MSKKHMTKLSKERLDISLKKLISLCFDEFDNLTNFGLIVIACMSIVIVKKIIALRGLSNV